MKKNILLFLETVAKATLSLMLPLFFMAADAQAQEWCIDDSCCYEDETNFYAKIFGGANFLQNTEITENKSTYQPGYMIAGSLGYCWHL